ncbi:hypothetical protein LTR62_002321 [Meristemomyces frigidus]|uniref:Cytochrome P450 n=1 Tax=Meristemomyces frigidus TaxID=1508187 RepID=A0AAN7YB53_9PEZI|nr:hypothetical protein LTR62_002321 [Meristemomyces frigidus]
MDVTLTFLESQGCGSGEYAQKRFKIGHRYSYTGCKYADALHGFEAGSRRDRRPRADEGVQFPVVPEDSKLRRCAFPVTSALCHALRIKGHVDLTHAMSSQPEMPTFPFARHETYHPPPENAKLRRECPIAKVKLFDNSEAWILMNRKDCCAALESEHLSADRRHPAYPEIHEGGAKAKEQRPTFVNLDNPEHDEQRNMLESWFTHDAAEKLRPMISRVVESNVDRLVKQHGEHPEKPVDFIEEFAALVPPQVIYHVLGIPEKDIPKLSRDSEVRTSTARDAAQTSSQNLQSYMKDFVHQRVEEPKNDLVSHLVVGPYKEGKLTEDDIVNLAFLVLVAGNAALINSIALGVVTLLQHPDQLDELKQTPSLAPKVTSELLRYHTASALNSRRAVKEDTEIGGQPMKKNDKLICSVQSADRDEDYFKDPSRFDMHRPLNPADTLGFGWGPHRCQGEWLSRVELETVFGTLFTRLPNLRLAVAVHDLDYSPPTQNVGITKMPVLW